LFFDFSVPASGGLLTLAPSSRFPHFFGSAWEQQFFVRDFCFYFSAGLLPCLFFGGDTQSLRMLGPLH